MMEMWVAGITVDPKTKSPIVILRNKESSLVLPIWVGVLEANAIAITIERMEIVRPMTHDLMQSLLESSNTSLRMVEIADIKDNTYFALLHLKRGNMCFTLDSRPSDAIAIALRCRAPIMISSKVMEHTLPVENVGVMSEGRDKLSDLLDKMDPEQFSKYKM
jgi:bifunctional DNase/RNase